MGTFTFQVGYGEQTNYIPHLHSANHENSKLTGVLGNATQKNNLPDM